MKRTMKAWIIYDFNDMRLEEVPIPKLSAGWALIRLESFQPSVTEVQRYEGFGIEGIEKVKKILLDKGSFQLFGHEFSGKVVEVADHIRKVKIGQRVSLNTVRSSCGKCQSCLEGRHKECLNPQWIGIDYPGCFAEYVAVPEELLMPVPAGLTVSETTCLQPLASVIAHVDQANIEMGDTVVVLGLGVMGNNVAQVVRVSGVGKVIASDIREENLTLARDLGIDTVVDAKIESIENIVKKETKGVGADIVFECAGGNPAQGLAGGETLKQAINVVRKGGKVCQVAHLMPGNRVAFEFKTLRKKNIAYLGNNSATDKHFYHGANLILTKRINVVSSVTHILEGIDKLSEAFEITGSKGKYKALNPAQVVVWKDQE